MAGPVDEFLKTLEILGKEARKDWGVSKKDAEKKWETWCKDKKNADKLEAAKEDYKLLDFGEDLGPNLEKWYKKDENLKQFQKHYVLISKALTSYKKKIKEVKGKGNVPANALKPLTDVLISLTQWADARLEEAEDAYLRDEGRAAKDSKKETKEVQEGKLIPPIILISQDIAKVLASSGLTKEELARIGISGKLEIIIGDAEIRRQFSGKQIDVSALQKVTNKAGFDILTEQIGNAAKTILKDMDTKGLSVNAAKGKFKTAVDSAVASAQARAVAEAERISGMKSLATAASIKTTFKVIGLVSGAVGGALTVALSVMSGNVIGICTGMYAIYKSILGAINLTAELVAELEEVLDEVADRIRELKDSYEESSRGAIGGQEVLYATLNELVGWDILGTLKGLKAKLRLGLEKLARMEVRIGEASEELNGLLDGQEKAMKQIKEMKKSNSVLTSKEQGILSKLETAIGENESSVNALVEKVIGMNERSANGLSIFKTLDEQVEALSKATPTWAKVGAVVAPIVTSISISALAGLGPSLETPIVESIKLAGYINTGLGISMAGAEALTDEIEGRLV